MVDDTRPGPDPVDEPVVITLDPVSGFPVISVGRRVTSADVLEALAQE